MKRGAERYAELMGAARMRNATRDELDRSEGFVAPSDLPPLETVRTAMAAIEAGIRMVDWTCIAEAQAMLESVAGRDRTP